MQGTCYSYAINEHPLPVAAGKFTLELTTPYEIVGLDVSDIGNPRLLVQEATRNCKGPALFRLVASKEKFELEGPECYLGSFRSSTRHFNLLHLIGSREVKPGGVLYFGGK